MYQHDTEKHYKNKTVAKKVRVIFIKDKKSNVEIEQSWKGKII